VESVTVETEEKHIVESATVETEQEHIVNAVPPTDTTFVTETGIHNSYETHVQEEQHNDVTEQQQQNHVTEQSVIPKQEADGRAVEELQKQLGNVTKELATVHADLLVSEGKEEALENEIAGLKETVRRTESGILKLVRPS
jgi:hypothetical protein